MRYKIANILKNSRKKNNYSAEYVVKKLQQYGLDISEKTLYGYEKGIRQPNADMFVCLCRIYNISSINLFFEENLLEDTLKQNFNELNSFGQKKSLEYINDLLENPKYTKTEASAVKKTKTAKRNYEIAAWGADGTKGTYKSPKREIT